MGSRITILSYERVERRKRLGVLLLLITFFVFIFFPITSNAVLSAITDVATDSAQMGQDAIHHAAKMAVLNAIKSIVKGLASAAKTFFLFFEHGLVVSVFVDSFANVVCSSAVDIVRNVVDFFDSTAVLFAHDIGQFFVNFSSKIGWLFWIVGAAFATLELGITYRSNLALGEHSKNLALNIFKSLLAVNLFTVLPVKVYLFFSQLSLDVIEELFDISNSKNYTMLFMRFDDSIAKIILAAITIFCAFKVFFAVIKRAGVLLVLITLGSLHMVSIPRGFWEGFWSWTKQIIAVIATNFCQLIFFSAGVALAFGSNSLALDMAGLSCMLVSCEVPRIAERFGLDTSIKASASSAVSTMSTMIKFIK